MQHPVPPSPFDHGAHAVKEPAAHRVTSPVEAKRFTSEELLAGAREVEIQHQGAIYRLKITSLGKLILTK